MKKNLLIIVFLMLISNFSVFANRAMYVDRFADILGNTTLENNLLNYAQNNQIETLLLYELQIINTSVDLSNPLENDVLAAFIFKAKTMFGIKKIGATAENQVFFENVINVYNNSRTLANEKFDIYNLEFEFWVASQTAPGSASGYCDYYLLNDPKYTCDNAGAFDFFIDTLKAIKILAANSSHPITTETYIGKPSIASRVKDIGPHVDLIRISAYVKMDNLAEQNKMYDDVSQRLKDYADANPSAPVSIIFSAENIFMESWFQNYTIDYTENAFTNLWQTDSINWTNNITLADFTYFSYTFISGETLSVNQSFANTEKIYPNPVNNYIYIEGIYGLKTTTIYNNLGKLILTSSEAKIDVSNLSNGIYLLKIEKNKGFQYQKIIKN